MKLYRIVYNDGYWHTGGPPSALFIGHSENEVKENSKIYKDFKELQDSYGGDLYIFEVTNLANIGIENGSNFEFCIKEKEK